ncbi:MAG: LysM peptidoglycan-binding domain-containing protein [Hyphomonadaceae bacterium]|nr:LysM peptidoglycan-binding domain-containing protein [Hyphomonadaceae bacterium]
MAGGYTVQAGETLRSIAARLYGDASLWWKIAEANGLSGEAALIEGQSLILPAGALKNTHNASTFTPYDPADIIGDTAPTTPAQPKPKKNKCGGVGQIIVAIIAVAVVAILAPGLAGGFSSMLNGGTFAGGFSAGMGANSLSAAALAGAKVGAASIGASGVAAGTVTAGAIMGGAAAGAAGSIASQGVAVATGIQDKFSWSAVAIAAISGGIGGSGSNFGVGGSSIASNALRQGVASALTQGVGVATGLQDKFSWAGVAAAAVGAYAGARAPASPFNIARSGASLIADAATRSLIEGSNFGDNIRAALPNVIAQTVGEAIAGRIAGSGTTTAEKSKLVQKQKVITASAGDKADYLATQAAMNQTADDKLAAMLLGDDLDGPLQDDLIFDGDAEGLLQLTGGGTRPPPRGASRGGGRPGIGHNGGPGEVEPAPERLYLDWANMSDEEYFDQLGQLMRQRESEVRIAGLQDAIRSLDPNYEFHPIATARGSGQTYEGYLREELNVLRVQWNGPLGMEGGQWTQFRGDVTGALNSSNFRGAEGYLRGSAVSGVSFRRGILGGGTGGPKDFDAAIVSSGLFNAARDAGFGVRGGATRTEPLTAGDLARLGVRGLPPDINNLRVTYVIFNSSSAMYQRPGPAVPLATPRR